MYNYNKLSGRITEKFGNQRGFAANIGVTEITISNKLTGKRGFSQEDIEQWMSALEIDRQQIHEYFFSPKV